eukprot:jgi/Psemu1/29761/gm1.29761_g
MAPAPAPGSKSGNRLVEGHDKNGEEDSIGKAAPNQWEIRALFKQWKERFFFFVVVALSKCGRAVREVREARDASTVEDDGSLAIEEFYNASPGERRKFVIQ